MDALEVRRNPFRCDLVDTAEIRCYRSPVWCVGQFIIIRPSSFQVRRYRNVQLLRVGQLHVFQVADKITFVGLTANPGIVLLFFAD